MQNANATQDVYVVEVVEAGSYNGVSEVAVTLQLGEVEVTCDGIIDWMDEYADVELFTEWLQLAMEGEEGYTVN